MYIAQTRLLVVGQHRKVFTRFAKGWNSCLFVKKNIELSFCNKLEAIGGGQEWKLGRWQVAENQSSSQKGAQSGWTERDLWETENILLE